MEAMKRMRVALLLLVFFAGTFLGWTPCTGAEESCDDWVARVVSVQGMVQARRAGETQWVPVTQNDIYCPGDMIRVLDRSRAAVMLRNEATLRLDQNTTISLTGPEKDQPLLLKLLSGAAHFLSRIPRSLKVATPFVNGAVEGTEFLVRVEPEQTFISVFQGRVAATNEAGSLLVASGQSAVAEREQAPALRVVVRPRDAVQWALYYPPILEYRPVDFPDQADTDWQPMVRRSLAAYWEGEIAAAFSNLEGVPEDISDPRFFTYRAALLLTVGRVEEASDDIARALKLDPASSYAFALQAIIAVVQNQKEQAIDLAQKAADLDPDSSVARVALSYFDLRAALKSVQEAVQLDPENGLAWARLADLRLSFGYLGRALEAAKKAVDLNPHIAHTQSVLGFAYLAQIKIPKSKEAFGKAIVLDQAAPLPRLGLGLAKIRDGELKGGGTEIEIAACLDPNNSLIRSYLGKAFFDQKRTWLDGPQFDIAKELDPSDPTPWFYDAIRKQTINRPVEALQEMQKSIELNNNRAVFRSKLLLDQDLAARSASIARIYNDLGFQQRGLVEGWKSVNTDPANYSAHRFLADTYAALPRHEIARVSELLQSQLLQPLNVTPIQPSLAASNLFILEAAGPSEPSFNEFNPLFLRNRLALQASGVVGENDTLGGEVAQSGVWDKMSYSLGLFHYETDGFRENNDQDQEVYNIFTQASLSPKTSILAEYRGTDNKRGDLLLRFDPDRFSANRRLKDDTDSIRGGLRYSFSPKSDLIATLIYIDSEAKGKDSSPGASVDIKLEDDGFMAETQHLFRSHRFRLTSGVGYFDADRKETTSLSAVIPFPPFVIDDDDVSKSDIHHTNLYVYSQINYPKSLYLTLGASADFLDGAIVDRDRFNPKFGLVWTPFAATTVRAAAFRTLRRTLISSQTIEPTQVAGFNQFFDDKEGTEAWRYGVAIDQVFSPAVYAGAEYSQRELDVPFEDLRGGGGVKEADWNEKLGRAYLYWTPHNWLAFSAEYQFERFKRDPENPGAEEEIRKVKTHRLPLGIGLFHPLGFTVRLRATYIDQEGDFGNLSDGFTHGDDQFWVADATIGYRLPKRYGLLTVEARNLFDEDFNFQDTDPGNPRISPDRLILARFTLSF